MKKPLIKGCLLVFAGLLPLSSLHAGESYLCKGDVPLLVRLDFSVLSPSRLAASIDSNELFPHTGKSWRLLWNRVQEAAPKWNQKVLFKSYDESYIYHLSLPSTIAEGSVQDEFFTLLTWQTDENGSVFSETLKCYKQSSGPG